MERPTNRCRLHGTNRFETGDGLYRTNRNKLRTNCIFVCVGYLGFVFGIIGFPHAFLWPFTSDMCGSNNTTVPVSVERRALDQTTEGEMLSLAEENTSLSPVLPLWTTHPFESYQTKAQVMVWVEISLNIVTIILAVLARFSRCPACIASYLFYVCFSSFITGVMMFLNCVLWSVDLASFNCFSALAIMGCAGFSFSGCILLYIPYSCISIMSSLRHLAPEESCSCCCTFGRRGGTYIRI